MIGQSARLLSPTLLVLITLLLSACSQEPPETESTSPADWPTDLLTPIAGATFSLHREHMPGPGETPNSAGTAAFRFLDGYAGRLLGAGEPVVTVAEGEILRIDQAYENQDPEELAFLAGMADKPGLLGGYAVDRLRGRQVWVRHPSGHVSIYSHLSEVHPELRPGDPVEQGQVIGRLGNSGALPRDGESQASPRLGWELWAPGGSHHLGQDMEPLDIHRQVAGMFSNQALPRFARQTIARAQSGDDLPMEYPPSPLPETELMAEPPVAVTAGMAFAFPVTWDGDSFEPDDFLVMLDGLPTGILDAGNGLWVIGAMPLDRAGEELHLELVAVDAYGRTLRGGQAIHSAQPSRSPAPRPVDQSYLIRYSPDSLQQEAEQLLEVALQALQRLDARWNAPFGAPLDGDVTSLFGQALDAGGPTKPLHPLPGVIITPDVPTDVVASNAGMVSLVTQLPIRDRTVAVSHGAGVFSVYSGLVEVSVTEGDEVSRGQAIGRADGPIQWEIHVGLTPSDPLSWLDHMLPE
jgi:peptidoglycan LD-endopeptidase LytH